MNCKNCKWLRYYDGYFCGNECAKIGFIGDIEKDFCSEFEQRKGKFWINDDGDF